ncbi:hypothetical protein [Desulfosporosinus sp. BICA1-9]|uniref:hypothetical protein n=1 Tax=Desulfosporosinus sp. BICA1-9 TaxID=1531958 RepID=UPI00054C02B4|nr:hypothetical protein [Desulfosporosinus sp. BICA1-9]KJS47502.1 MAG: hypothetical protein VR66_19325 [Peptococcaceae bacterium BRH_c23]KJS90342.1 MAG: hypothetical protein JL57_02315 [Desulfosporosinus sp. BICA1-9]
MGIPVEQNEKVYWEDLNFEIHIVGELDGEILDAFRELINSWYILGVHSTFGGPIHSKSDIWYEDSIVGFSIDMGSAEKEAVEILLCAVEGFAEFHNIIIDKVVLGRGM